MTRTAIVSTALIAGLLIAPDLTAGPAPGAAQAAQVTAADAAPFVGDWALAMQGQNGPAAFDLAVKVEKDKVVGELKSPELPAQAITDITIVDKSLVLRYSFDYQGNGIPAVLSLMPADGGKTNAQIDFAAGAYVMSGTATKKEKEK